jgi:hypothetical protein
MSMEFRLRKASFNKISTNRQSWDLTIFFQLLTATFERADLISFIILWENELSVNYKRLCTHRRVHKTQLILGFPRHTTSVL